MLTKRLISNLALSAVLLAAGAALPAVAHAHDGDHRGSWNERRDNDWEWRHRQHWHHRDYGYYAPQPQVYERYYVQPRVYYAPRYVHPEPREGVTIIYRNRWQ